MRDLTVIELDLRGKACPGPVIATKKALSSIDQETKEVILTVQLDNQAACANVTRFAESQNFMVAQEADAAGLFTLTITRGFSCELPPLKQPALPDQQTPGRYLVYIDSSKMGSGDERLGGILMKAFLKTLPELENLPTSIIFLNDGVFLATSDSPEIESIKALENTGCSIWVCGTCLDFYNLKDKLAVGQISNMFEIATLITGPEKVVRT
ncbi:MAG: sulfurtransferase-like selenium metabolism protein YedF [Deltaproteobacteria bacterium]|nr:sulfurtransferase-like selenium metabolism protein YedF [Candidatus Tharpella sp.]